MQGSVLYKIGGNTMARKKAARKSAAKKTRRRKRGPLAEAVEKVEVKVITRYLKKNNWKKKPAAKELGISRNTLSTKVKKYKLSAKKSG